MIDWHSHVLPQLDDGSSSVDESLSLLKSLWAQGVKTVIATPHFYADSHSVHEFLKKRELSYSSLKSKLTEAMPQIILGAEVCFYPGIGNLENLKDLCISGTNLLLLEMPLSQWTEHTVNEVIGLADSGEYTVVLAHVERYIKFQHSGVLEKMAESGILMQINASCINRFSTKRKACRMLKNRLVQFVGSDCHNIDTRPPRIGEASDYIRKKLGEDFVCKLDEFGYEMLNLNS